MMQDDDQERYEGTGGMSTPSSLIATGVMTRTRLQAREEARQMDRKRRTSVDRSEADRILELSSKYADPAVIQELQQRPPVDFVVKNSSASAKSSKVEETSRVESVAPPSTTKGKKQSWFSPVRVPLSHRKLVEHPKIFDGITPMRPGCGQPPAPRRPGLEQSPETSTWSVVPRVASVPTATQQVTPTKRRRTVDRQFLDTLRAQNQELYDKLMRQVKMLKEQEKQLYQDIRNVDEVVRALKRYAPDTMAAHMIQYNLLQGAFGKYGLLYQAYDKFVAKVLPNITQQVNSALQKYTVRCQRFLRIYEEHDAMSTEEELEKNLSSFQEILREIRTIEDATRLYQDYQKMVGIKVIDITLLGDARRKWDHVQNLVTFALDWRVVVKMMENEIFSEQPWRSHLERVSSFLLRLSEIQQNRSAVFAPKLMEKLRSNIQDYQRRLEIVIDMAQPFMKAHHWQQVLSLLDISNYISASGALLSDGSTLTLGFLQSRNLWKFEGHIREITVKAHHDALTESKIDEMKKRWYSTLLPTVRVDEFYEIETTGALRLLSLFEHDLVTVQTLAQITSSTELSSTLAQWAEEISNYQEILDTWIMVQNDWKRLSLIFHHHDVQQSIVDATYEFQSLDRKWKAMMAAAKGSSSLAVCLREVISRAFLNNCSVMSEKLWRELGAYLAEKRHFLPRLYFISDRDLLHIIASTRYPARLCTLISKCFHEIHSLRISQVEIGGRPREGGSLQTTGSALDPRTSSEITENTTVQLYDIESVIGFNREEELWIKALRMSSSPEIWLKDLWVRMCDSIKEVLSSTMDGPLLALYGSNFQELQKQLNTTPSSPANVTSNWLQSRHWTRMPLHVIALCINVMLTNELSSLVAAERNGFEWTSFWEAFYAKRSNLVSFVRHPDTVGRSRFVASNLIVLFLNQEHSIRELQSEQPSPTSSHLGHHDSAGMAHANYAEGSSFSWTKLMRFYYDPFDKKCVIHQCVKSYEYGNAFLGGYTAPILSPLCDRAILAMNMALSLEIGGILHSTPSQTSGKRAMLRELSSAVGCECIQFDCSGDVTYSQFHRLLLGAIQSESCWLSLFGLACQGDMNVVRTLAYDISRLKDAINANQGTFVLDGGSVDISNPRMAIWVSVPLDVNSSAHTSLMLELSHSLMPIACTAPNLERLAEVTLTANGMTEAARLSRRLGLLIGGLMSTPVIQLCAPFTYRQMIRVANNATTRHKAHPWTSEEKCVVLALWEELGPIVIQDQRLALIKTVRSMFPSAEDLHIGALGVLTTRTKDEHDKADKSKTQRMEPEDLVYDSDEEDRQRDLMLLRDRIRSLMDLCHSLVATDPFIRKLLDMYQVVNRRVLTIVVGPSACGKTTSIDLLSAVCVPSAAGLLHHVKGLNRAVDDRVKVYRLFAGAFHFKDIYGHFNEDRSWADGFITRFIKQHWDDSVPQLKARRDTTSEQVLHTVESGLPRKMRGHYCPGAGKKALIVVVENINLEMERRLESGATCRPCSEMIRQVCDGKGSFSKASKEFVEFRDVNITCSFTLSPYGYPRLSSRFLRHFHLLRMVDPAQDVFRSILASYPDQFLQRFSCSHTPGDIARLCRFSIETFNAIRKRLPPTNSSPYLQLSLNDVMRCFNRLMTASVKCTENLQDLELFSVYCTYQVYRSRVVTPSEVNTLQRCCLDVGTRHQFSPISLDVIHHAINYIFADYNDNEGCSRITARAATALFIAADERFQWYNRGTFKDTPIAPSLIAGMEELSEHAAETPEPVTSEPPSGEPIGVPTPEATEGDAAEALSSPNNGPQLEPMRPTPAKGRGQLKSSTAAVPAAVQNVLDIVSIVQSGWRRLLLYGTEPSKRRSATMIASGSQAYHFREVTSQLKLGDFVEQLKGPVMNAGLKAAHTLIFVECDSLSTEELEILMHVMQKNDLPQSWYSSVDKARILAQEHHLRAFQHTQARRPSVSSFFDDLTAVTSVRDGVPVQEFSGKEPRSPRSPTSASPHSPRRKPIYHENLGRCLYVAMAFGSATKLFDVISNYPNLYYQVVVKTFYLFDRASLGAVYNECLGGVAVLHETLARATVTKDTRHDLQGLAIAIHLDAMAHIHSKREHQRLPEQIGREYGAARSRIEEFLLVFKTLYLNQRKHLAEVEESLEFALRELEQNAQDARDQLTRSADGQRSLHEAIKSVAEGIVELRDHEQMERDARQSFLLDEQRCSALQSTIEQERDRIQSELAKTLPDVAKATEALSHINKYHITEMKSFVNPPQLVRLVMNFEKDRVDASLIERVKMFVNHPDFSIENMKRASIASTTLCKWVLTIVDYFEVMRRVAPMQKRLGENETQFQRIDEMVRTERQKLINLEIKLNELRARHVRNLQREQECQRLHDSQSQWKTEVLQFAKVVDDWIKIMEKRLNDLKQHQFKLIGDCVIMAATASYASQIPHDERLQAIERWRVLARSHLNGRPSRRGEALDSVSMPHPHSFLKYWCLSGKLLQSRIRKTISSGLALYLDIPLAMELVLMDLMDKVCAKIPLLLDPLRHVTRWLKSEDGPNGQAIPPPANSSDSPDQSALPDPVQFTSCVFVVDAAEPNCVALLEKRINHPNALMILIENVSDCDEATFHELIDFVPLAKKKGNHEVVLATTTLETMLHWKPKVWGKINVIDCSPTRDDVENELLVSVISAYDTGVNTEFEAAKRDYVAEKMKERDIIQVFIKYLHAVRESREEVPRSKTLDAHDSIALLQEHEMGRITRFLDEYGGIRTKRQAAKNGQVIRLFGFLHCDGHTLAFTLFVIVSPRNVTLRSASSFFSLMPGVRPAYIEMTQRMAVFTQHLRFLAHTSGMQSGQKTFKRSTSTRYHRKK
ncbi:hypothetical protein Poli38472_008321 [Pythium oligandrum]|uniref:Dynein heavy chain n=1 Tax=Pythium oligandrum TaxID=41045 RepID=A0A8K1CLE9_PYTOL|nr:hypothetical protein Poli38472_008321 [Pythium oligandrum]|eukprot:TMW65679.1 hypothetical protein Poli38472_008321 [Pythium oligandrum]